MRTIFAWQKIDCEKLSLPSYEALYNYGNECYVVCALSVFSFVNPHEIFEADQCRTEIQCPENPWLSKYRDATGVVTSVEGRRTDFRTSRCHLWHLVGKVNGKINFQNKRKEIFYSLVSTSITENFMPQFTWQFTIVFSMQDNNAETNEI